MFSNQSCVCVCVVVNMLTLDMVELDRRVIGSARGELTKRYAVVVGIGPDFYRFYTENMTCQN